MTSNGNSHNSASEPAPKNSAKAKKMNRATARHIVPFIIWVGVLVIAHLMHLTPSSASETIKSLDIISDATLYLFSSAVCAILFIILRPWRYYEPIKSKNILPAVGLGVFVFFLWIVFETEFINNLSPALADFYEKWCVMPFGEKRSIPEILPYSPATCGWPLTIAKLLGSAFVISIIEEFFWRGWLLRFIRTPDFLDIDIGEFHLPAFIGVALIFGFEHSEWAVGVITGLIWGIFFIKTRDVWSTAISHVTTNLLLGIYVIATGSWQFW